MTILVILDMSHDDVGYFFARVMTIFVILDMSHDEVGPLHPHTARGVSLRPGAQESVYM